MLGLGIAVWPAVAQDTDIRLWIERLGDSRFSRRQEASQRLRQLGDQAIPWLSLATSSQHDEIRTRANLILDELRQAAFNQKMITAPRVQLKIRHLPIEEALANAAKQLGVQLKLCQPLDSATAQPITLDTGLVPWWQALNELCNAAQLHCKGVIQSPDPSGHAPSPCVVELEPVKLPKLPTDHRTRWLIRPRWPNNYERVGDQRLVHFEAISTDRQTQAILAVVVIQARDQDGNDLCAVGRATNASTDACNAPTSTDHDWHPPSLSHSADFTIHFNPQSRPVRSIQELEGVLILRVVSTQQTLVEVEDVVGSIGKTSQDEMGHQLKILHAQEQLDDTLQLRVQLTTPTGSPSSVAHQPILHLLNIDSGVPLKQHEIRLESTTRLMGSTTAILTATFAFPPGQRFSRLKWIGPATAIVEVPFLLRDIPVENDSMP